jgi:hypothetical protein
MGSVLYAAWKYLEQLTSLRVMSRLSMNGRGLCAVPQTASSPETDAADKRIWSGPSYADGD